MTDLELLELAARVEELKAAAPAVHGEPVAWQRVDRPERIITVLSRRTWKEVEDGVEFRALYAAPQPAPNVDVLVEALELIEKGEDTGPDGWGAFRWADCRNIARAALAAHRKGGDQ